MIQPLPTTTRRTALKAIVGAGAALLTTSAFSRSTAATAANPFAAKAIYFNPKVTTDPAGFDRLLELIARTELNALVIDIKEDAVYYATQVAFFQRYGAVVPLYDPVTLIADLHDRGIYVIGRLVCFKDPVTALNRPDLAVINHYSGEPWYDGGGATWMNPFAEEVWDANIALATEATELGFDEIQFDYIRLPDGDLTGADFGPREFTYTTRTTAVAGFLGRAQRRLAPLGGRLGADIFGYTLLVDDDLGIGQDAEMLAPLVDILCPMVYPSHFPDGSLDVPGHPNDFPADTIAISMGYGAAKFGTARGLRPWLQAFSLPWLRPYTASDVRAQIDAADAAGTSGWMLWDPTNRYDATDFAAAIVG